MMTKCVLVDFDGTITTRDTVRYLLQELVRSRPWKSWHVFRLLAVKLCGVSPAHLQREKSRCIGSLIEGLEYAGLQAALSRYHARIRPYIRASMMQVVEEALSDECLVLIVTASPQFAVEGMFKRAGVVCIGTRYRAFGRKFDGALDGDICYGQAKVNAINSAVQSEGADVDFVAAWTDSLSDLPMMMLARERFWIYDGSVPTKFHSADPEGRFISSQSLA